MAKTIPCDLEVNGFLRRGRDAMFEARNQATPFHLRLIGKSGLNSVKTRSVGAHIVTLGKLRDCDRSDPTGLVVFAQ